MADNLKSRTVSGFIWRVMQQVTTQAVNFIISIVLARIIAPEDYGIVAITTVFISLSNVIINTGFSSSVVQKKDLTETELSSVFSLSIIIALGLYGILYIGAPFVSYFYGEPIITKILRVQSITMIIASASSIPLSLLNREMKFKITFVISLIGAIVHGVVGVYMALNNYGVWALVVPSVISAIVTCFFYFILTKWKPCFTLKLNSINSMISFSAKILLSNVVNTLYKNIQSLIIGKQYSKSMLGYYNKGSQFPMLIMGCIDTSMNTVLFSTLSKVQDENDRSLTILRRSMKTSMYVCTPLMVGLVVTAKPLVQVLLTDKWLDCVPFVQIMALICITYPLAARLQAINAIGNSTMTLRINILTNAIAIILMIISTRFSVIVFALANLFGSMVEVVITTVVSSRVLNYKVMDFIKDIVPACVCSSIMGIIVFFVSFLPIRDVILLLTQVFVGIIVYVGISVLFKIEAFYYIIGVIKRKNNNE